MPKFDCDGVTSAIRSRTAMRSKLSCDAMITGLRCDDQRDGDIMRYGYRCDAMMICDDAIAMLICDAMRDNMRCEQQCDKEIIIGYMYKQIPKQLHKCLHHDNYWRKFAASQMSESAGEIVAVRWGRSYVVLELLD